MITAYICSPYRAKEKQQLKRNKGYAKKLTRMALDCGIAPVTPHLYITKVTDEENKEDRRSGMAAGIELLLRCDVVMLGSGYGISEGMKEEIKTAKAAGIAIVDVDMFADAQGFIEEVKKASNYYENGYKKRHFIRTI